MSPVFFLLVDVYRYFSHHSFRELESGLWLIATPLLFFVSFYHLLVCLRSSSCSISRFRAIFSCQIFGLTSDSRVLYDQLLLTSWEDVCGLIWLFPNMLYIMALTSPPLITEVLWFLQVQLCLGCVARVELQGYSIWTEQHTAEWFSLFSICVRLPP